MPLDFPQAQRRLSQLLKIRLALGDLAGAETAIQAMAPAQTADQTHNLHVELYLAFAAWEKAREAALADDGPQAGGRLDLVQKEKLAFYSLPPERRFVYFLDHGNFALAWEMRPNDDRSSLAGQLQTARLAFLAGREDEGKGRIATLARQGGSDFRILNSLGNFYFDLRRAGQALPFYQRSLLLNPRQPALQERVGLIARSPE